MTINLGHVCHTFAAGHRLEVPCTSSNFPRRARNTNSGHPILAKDGDAEIRVATNVVHNVERTPSFLASSRALSFSNHTSTGGFGGIHVRLARAELGLSCMTPERTRFCSSITEAGAGRMATRSVPLLCASRRRMLRTAISRRPTTITRCSACGRRLPPLLQSVWYIGAGLDIWNQLLFKYFGRCATTKGVQVPPPDYGPVVWLEDAQPIKEAGDARRTAAFVVIATMTGDLSAVTACFSGLAEEAGFSLGYCRKPSNFSALSISRRR